MNWKRDHEKWAQRGRDFLERQRCVVSFLNWRRDLVQDDLIQVQMMGGTLKTKKEPHSIAILPPIHWLNIVFEMLCMCQQPWEVKTASYNTNPTHCLTFFLICLIVGWVHTLHDSGLIIMITLWTHWETISSYFIELQYDNFFPNKSTLWLSYSILWMVQKSCTTWDVQYPLNCGIFTQYQPDEPDFFHQPYLRESSPGQGFDTLGDRSGQRSLHGWDSWRWDVGALRWDP